MSTTGGGGSSRERTQTGSTTSRKKSDRDRTDLEQSRAVAVVDGGGRERSDSFPSEKTDHRDRHRDTEKHASETRSRSTVEGGLLGSTGGSRSHSPIEDTNEAQHGPTHHFNRGRDGERTERHGASSSSARDRERTERTRDGERGERESSMSRREKKLKKKKEPKRRKISDGPRVASAHDLPQSLHHSSLPAEKGSEHLHTEDGSLCSHRDRKEKKGKKRKEAKLAKEKAKAEAAAATTVTAATEKGSTQIIPPSSSRIVEGQSSGSGNNTNNNNSSLQSSSGPGHASSKRSIKKKSLSAQEQHTLSSGGYSAAQNAVNDMMRRALEEDQYSALGSVVDTDSSDSEDEGRIIHVSASGSSSKVGRGHSNRDNATTTIRLDRNVIMGAMRKRLRLEGMRGSNVIESKSGRSRDAGDGNLGGSPGSVRLSVQSNIVMGKGDEPDVVVSGRKKKKKKGKRGVVVAKQETEIQPSDHENEDNVENNDTNVDDNEANEDDDGSIFGQNNSSNNSTWVECDKCKKWRRLRGVVDAKKLLPLKWFCHMNKNDPERAKCTAPEEEYDTPSTPESATDQRARKHLRLWVRRLQCNEAYEARLPTMTRGRKRGTNASKEPYEWVRCCNPSCGKWRAILRFMDANSNVVEHAKNKEWYCVQNTWDEKIASCAAPQENLPAIGCPHWVMQDEEEG